MFGFVSANLEELTKEEKVRYNAVYCGICRAIREQSSSAACLGLSYDMAFLALLLMSLYEPEETSGSRACGLHPIKPRPWVDNEYIRYCAQMNVALGYYNAMDDYEDEGHLRAKWMAGVFGKELETVKVPALVGEVYSDYLAQELDEFNIQLRPQQYDAHFEKGVIMSQEPAGGTEVKKGADIWITVSMGAEPAVKIMENYVGARQEGVESALKGQGFTPIFFDEASDQPVGVVIRTDPEAGTELEEGQAIRIFVSSGPDIVTGKMLNVVGKDVTHAVELLNAKGFENVSTKTVPSEEPAGTVIYQSETADEEIDVTTKIILEVSEGPVEETKAPAQEQAPVPEETKPALPTSRKSISFALPDRDTAYNVTVLRDGVPIVSNAPVDPSSQVFTIPDVEGSGTSVFELVIDGAVYSSQSVEF